MKIYFASQSFYPHIGGVSTYLLNLQKEVQKLGNEVLEIHLRLPNQLLEEEIQGIRIHRVPKEPLSKELLEGYSHFKEVFQKAILGSENNFPANIMELEGYEEFFNVNKAFGEEVRELLEMHPAEIVHVHDFQLVFLYKYVPRGTPLLLTWHGPFYSKMKEGLKKFIIENMKEYDKVIFSSLKYQKAAVKAGLLKEKTEVLHPIANTNKFVPLSVDKKKIRKKYKIPRNRKIILCVQRPDWRSSHLQLIKALPRVLKKTKKVALVFVGGKSLSGKISSVRDTYQQEIDDLVKKLKLSRYVFFLGNIDYGELPELYNTAEIVASTPKMETFGLSITEGMSCGKPILGTRVGGIPLQVKNNVNGFLVKVDDIKSTSEKILKLLSSRKLRRKMGQESLKIIKRKFRIEKGIEKHLKIYQNLLKKKSEFWRLEMLNLENIQAIITDFDRTLSSKNGRIKSKLLKKMKSLEKPFILVTGKKLEDVKELCKRYHVWQVVIAENGAIIYFPKTKKTVIFTSPYIQQAREILRNSEILIAFGQVIISSKVENMKKLKEILKPLRKKLSFQKNIDEVMILPEGVNKGESVSRVLEELEIKPEKTIIIGDAENDIPLFKIPGYRVAVANADRKLKKLADEVTKKSSEEGVIEVLDKLQM